MVGMIAAPPTPSSARAAITCHASVAATAPSEAAANSAKPTSRSRLRPHRSPSAPKGHQQSGQGERVHVDDPQLLHGARLKIGDQ